MWSAFEGIKYVRYGSDWNTNIITPQTTILTDPGDNQLAAVSWVTPSVQDSDHPSSRSDMGPSWVASVVNAIGESPYWDSTAIIVLWDDWGGWFDPVQPVYEDYDGLGFRVPLLMVSPYAKRGYVTHVQYETSSVLRFIEDNFGLPQLAKSDQRAADPVGDAFDYYQPPRKFKTIGGAKPSSYWMRLERASQARPKPKSIIGDD